MQIAFSFQFFDTNIVPHRTPEINTSALPQSTPNKSPLRVLRVVDEYTQHSAGQMRISGCMADVCAELERLAGYENLSQSATSRFQQTGTNRRAM